MKNEKATSDLSAQVAQWAGIIVAAIGLIVLTIFILTISSEYEIGHPVDMSGTGQVGDFFGGVIGSLWAFAGVLLFYSALVWQKKDYKSQIETLNLQKDEMAMTKDVMKQQRFENTLFNLIDNHRALANSIRIKSGTRPLPSTDTMGAPCSVHEDVFIEGKAAIAIVSTRFRTVYRGKSTTHSDKMEAGDIYRQFHSANNALIGHYFRNLYHVLKFISSSHDEEIEAMESPSKDKRKRIHRKYKRYSEFIQASMTSDELFLAFYNGLHFERAYVLMERYEFLENLPREELIHTEHEQFYAKTQFKSLDE